MLRKIISLILCFSFSLTQSGFAQGVAELNLGQYLGQMGSGLKPDKFRPLHMRYFSYDINNDNFQLLLDKGDNQDIKEAELQDKTKVLMEYFQIGLALPNDKFWVNLRPDAQDQIIDPELEKTDLGKVMLEADLQLKKDTAQWTSPQTPEGRLYWDKLYEKARELFGKEPANIPTITRPWIVPGEIIVREGEASAYIFKANLKVMLEEDYIKSQVTSHRSQVNLQDYSFKDPRMKELNTYSTQLIRELIIPKLTKEVNTAKRYAGLRQVFFSLILARWFKERFSQSQVTSHRSQENALVNLIDSKNLTNLTSKEPWSKTFYFNEYKKSFEKGEYNLKEQLATPTGQVIRSYVSGGVLPMADSPLKGGYVGKEDGFLYSGNIPMKISNFLGLTKTPPLEEPLNIEDIKTKVSERLTETHLKYFPIFRVFENPQLFVYNGYIEPLFEKESPNWTKPSDALKFLRRTEIILNAFYKVFKSWKDYRKFSQFLKEEVAILKAMRKQIEKENPKKEFGIFGESYSEENYREEPKEVIEDIKDLLLYITGISYNYFYHPDLLNEGGKKLKKYLIDPLDEIIKVISTPGAALNLNPVVKSKITYFEEFLKQEKRRREFVPEDKKERVAEFEIYCSLIKYLIESLKRISGSSPLSVEEEARVIFGSFETIFEMKEEMLEKNILDYDKIEKKNGFPSKDKYFPSFKEIRKLVVRAKGGLEDLVKEKESLTPEASLSNFIAFGKKIIEGVKLIRVEAEGEHSDIEHDRARAESAAFGGGAHNIVGTKVHQEHLEEFSKYYSLELWAKSYLIGIDAFIKELSQIIPQSSAGQNLTAGVSSSLAKQEVGGIDFRTMQMLIHPMGSFNSLNLSLPTLSSSALERIDLDKELVSLRQMASSGIVPSGERVKEYLAAVFQKGRMPEKQDELFVSLVEIYRLLEDEVKDASSSLKEALVIVDTGRFVLLPNNQKVGVN